MWWDSVPNGSLQWSISCLVWFPWWLRHGAMDPTEGTLFRVNVDWPDFWIDTFNLVIRLPKVKQSALPFISPFATSRWFCRPLRTFRTCIFADVKFGTAEAFILLAAQAFWSETWQEQLKAKGMSPSCRYGLFCIWWGQTYCASNSLDFEQPFMPMWLDRPRSRFGSSARLLRSELSPFFTCCCFSFLLTN